MKNNETTHYINLTKEEFDILIFAILCNIKEIWYYLEVEDFSMAKRRLFILQDFVKYISENI